jgi:hypothetical protein
MWWTLLFAALRAVLIWLWMVAKPILGWLFIVVGLIGMPMPIVNGLIFLVIGIALVGPRNWLIRWSRVHIKLLLYRWAALTTPVVGDAGRLALEAARKISRQSRRLRWWWAEHRPRWAAIR